MRGRVHVCCLALVVLLVGVGSASLDAHQNPCHRWHACPSDSHAYVCGDQGRCDHCPDNQYCLAGKLRMASSPTAGPTQPSSQPIDHHTLSGDRVLYPRRGLYRRHYSSPDRRQAHNSGASLLLHFGAHCESAA
jgi:hypothetical protein